MRLSVIGLGKLGACLAAVLADSGFEVWGYDQNKSVRDKIRKHEAPVVEPGLDVLLKDNDVRVADSIEQAVSNSDLTFVVVPTPSDASGAFSSVHVLDAVARIGEAINNKKTRHTVVITSTVMPGSTEGEIRDALEQTAYREIGSMLGLAYSPEFIALGSVICDMREPDMILIGAIDDQSAGEVRSVMQHVVGEVPFHIMSCTEVEIAKISVNAYVTMKISFANTLGEMCCGLDVDKIAAAIGSDSRIGRKYLKPGGPYGGPCFTRDSKAFRNFAGQKKVTANLAFAADAINDRQVQRHLFSVLNKARCGNRVGIIGLAYKLNTPVTDNSLGIELGARLLSRGFTVNTYDPLVEGSTDSAQECVDASDIIVLAQPYDFIATLEFGDKPIIDVWNVLKTKTEAPSITKSHR